MIDTPYFNKSVKSLGHTPIYKMHKYFARRPHNVFRELIKHYTKEGDLIFDPFGGGGVTLVEGITENRRVIISDINPIASFIQLNQVAEVSLSRFTTIAEHINKTVQETLGDYYTTKCIECKANAHVRWYEHAYIVKCPQCLSETDLKNEHKAIGETGKPRNGFYSCKECRHVFKAADAPRIGSLLLNIRFNCSNCGTQDSKKPNSGDYQKLNFFNDNLQKISERYNLKIPSDEIPAAWDRQHEDCLHRKGFHHFSDLFTKRNLAVCAYYFSYLDSIRDELSDTEYHYMIFLISSLLRYTNNMNFSTSSWMDGRPVAWSKHAYWTPNQFIEVNPIEYFSNRIKAFKSGIKDRSSRFQNKEHSFDWENVLNHTAEYSVICGDSSKLELPDNSIDFILTDPPYGSNVQYGELCKFWDVWINTQSPFSSENELLKSEAVVHRRTKSQSYSKDFGDYYRLLNQIFNNCYRVLKPNGVMAFTFNNKDIRAWYSVIKAAIDAGFYIEPDAIFYQEGIDAYKDTAHLRFDGTPQGDFIYSFKKYSENYSYDFGNVSSSFSQCLEITLNDFKIEKQEFTLGSFYIKLFSTSTLCLIKQISDGVSESSINDEFSHDLIEKFLDCQTDLSRNGNRWIFK